MKTTFIFVFIAIYFSLLASVQAIEVGDERMGGIAHMAGTAGFAKNGNGQQALKIKNRQQAAQIIKERYRAKVLSIGSTRVNGNPGYRAKLLSNDGVVFYVSIDAVSGRVKKL
jgi:uncharacterized membrane protein YkoI